MSHFIKTSTSSLNVVFIRLIFVTLLLLSQSVFAEAGRVVFSYGNVTAESPNGVVRKLSKRDYVESGDIIRTSSSSLVQMRMIDKAFIALRSNSEVKIEAYRLGVSKEEDTGIFSLLRGGFRAVTGIIGKRLKSAYKMRTVTATIGIRGTDYTARLCNQDCNQAFGNITSASSIADGLYVGVNEGGINLTNQLGTLDVDELQFGYVKDATTAPVALITAPEFLYFNSRVPNPDAEQANNTDAETDSPTQSSVVASRAEVEPVSSDMHTDETIKQDLKGEQVEVVQEQIEQNIHNEQEVTPPGGGNSVPITDGEIPAGRIVVSTLSSTDLTVNSGNVAKVAANNLTEFQNSYLDKGVGTFSSGDASSINLGFDPETGITWGRWSAGIAKYQPASGEISNIDLSNSSLHWVTSPSQSPDIVLPSTGVASFDLVGNTSPTDNLGNTGVLGNASLSANFTNMTVDTSVAVGINNQVWSGAANGLPLSSAGSFTGSFDTMTVNTGNAIIQGTGDAAGFFTNNATGAGMGFSLGADIDGTSTTVNGTAVFQKP